MAFRLKVGHRYLVALDVTLSLGFSFSLADLAVVGGLAREPGLGIKPVHFEEDLLAHCRFHTDGLEIEIGHVGIAPIILHTRREDDGLAPGVRYTGRLTGGHLDDQFVSSLVRDSLDDDVLRSHPEFVIHHVGKAYELLGRIVKDRLPCHRPAHVEADVKIESAYLGGLPEHRLSGGVFSEVVPPEHLGFGQGLPGLRYLRHRRTAGYLGGSRYSGRKALQGKDATAAYLASRNTLCRPRESPESDGRKCNHSLSISNVKSRFTFNSCTNIQNYFLINNQLITHIYLNQNKK